jgi:predicted phage tail protein
VVVPNTTRYVDAGLTPGISCTYRVRAIGLGGASAWTAEVIGVPVAPPTAPGSLTASPISATQINLAWTDQSSSETAFAIWRRGSASDWSRIGVVAPDITQYADREVAPNTTYTYRVRAVNQGGASAWTAEVSAATLPLSPATPAGLSVTADEAQLELAWTDTSDNETAFAVWRKSGVGEWSRIAVLAPGSTWDTDASVATEALYTYRVRAVNQGGASAWSNEATGMPGLAAPTGLVLRNGAPTLAYLEWRDNSGRETGFELYRRQGEGEWRLLGTLPANQAAYFDFALEAGAAYTYRVRAVGSGGPSGWSNEARWTVPSTP